MSAGDNPDDDPVFHVNDHEDQRVIGQINRRLGVWSASARKSWRSRKRMDLARAELAAQQSEEKRHA